MKTARFVVYKDKKGQFRWRLQAKNGRILAQGEGHSRRSSAVRAIEAIKRTIIDIEMDTNWSTEKKNGGVKSIRHYECGYLGHTFDNTELSRY